MERYGGGKEDMLKPLLFNSVSLGSGNISVTVSPSGSVGGEILIGTSSTNVTEGVGECFVEGGGMEVWWRSVRVRDQRYWMVKVGRSC